MLKIHIKYCKQCTVALENFFKTGFSKLENIKNCNCSLILKIKSFKHFFFSLKWVFSEFDLKFYLNEVGKEDGGSLS